MAKKKSAKKKTPKTTIESVLTKIVGTLNGLSKRIDKLEKPDKSKKTTENPITKPSTKNKFESMPERNLHKEDTVKFDKKVWEGREPVARRENNGAKNIPCKKCNKEYMVFNWYDYKDSGFTCNDCLTTGIKK